MSNTGDDLDATRLLLTNEIGKLPVKGEHIAMPVNRGILIVTGSDDQEGLAEMARIAEESYEMPYSVAPLPFRLDGQDWHPWSLGQSHPHCEAFRSLALHYWAGVYQEQKKLLDESAKADENPRFAAAFLVAQGPGDGKSFGTVSAFLVAQRRGNGKSVGTAFWISSLTPTSLPKAEAILFCKQKKPRFTLDGTPDLADLFDSESRLVEWNVAVEILGDSIREESIYPMRYRVEEFPSGAKWEELKKIGWK